MFDLPNCQRYLVFYGKGGIGKSTVAINLAFALAELKDKVALIGCSPKSSLWDAYRAPEKSTILDIEREKGLKGENVHEAVMVTGDGVILVEAGGPEPGVGCGGRGLIFALEWLKAHHGEVSGLSQVQYCLYDVIGDVVCGGFAMPMKGGGRRDVYVVTSGELMSLYAANNIFCAIAKLQSSKLDVRVGGLIANLRGVPNEEEILTRFSQMTEVPVLAHLPHDPQIFGEAEQAGMPVVKALPNSPVAAIFRGLARQIVERPQRVVPKSIDNYEELFDTFMAFQRETMSHEAVRIASIPPVRPEPRPRSQATEAKKIAIYGTGGIGKSTISSNVSAAIVKLGERVCQIGCDPKRDSIFTLCQGIRPTVLDEFRKVGLLRVSAEIMKGLIYQGTHFGGELYGVECGGPSPGKGCAGRGVDVALEYLEKFHTLEEFGMTFVLYDVLGDTVCGGFATPLKYAPLIYVVTSGEAPSLVQAMKICQSVDTVSKQGLKVDSMGGVISHVGAVKVGIAGIINNKRGVPDEERIVEEVFGAVGLPVVHHVERSELVQKAENLKSTVVQAFPESPQAKNFVELAKKILGNEKTYQLSRPALSKVEVLEIVDRYRQRCGTT